MRQNATAARKHCQRQNVPPAEEQSHPGRMPMKRTLLAITAALALAAALPTMAGAQLGKGGGGAAAGGGGGGGGGAAGRGGGGAGGGGGFAGGGRAGGGAPVATAPLGRTGRGRSEEHT